MFLEFRFLSLSLWNILTNTESVSLLLWNERRKLIAERIKPTFNPVVSILLDMGVGLSLILICKVSYDLFQ